MNSTEKLAKHQRNARILVVDDDTDQLQLIDQALKQVFPDTELVLAANKQQALTYLEGCLQKKNHLPRIILLDLLLPSQQEGWQVLTLIRKLPFPISKIPVVILSHSNDLSNISESYDRGINSYIVKPLAFSDWVTHLRILKEYWWNTVRIPDMR